MMMRKLRIVKKKKKIENNKRQIEEKNIPSHVSRDTHVF